MRKFTLLYCLFIVVFSSMCVLNISAQQHRTTQRATTTQPPAELALPSTFINEFQVEHFGLEQGFSNEGVRLIRQDRHGYLWLISDLGLYRYDGMNFKRYTHVPYDTTSLFPPYYNAIAEDKNGLIWIAGAYGLQYFDPERDAFVRIHLPSASLSQRRDNEIRAIATDPRNNHLWLGTTNEVWLFDTETLRILKRFPIPYSGKSISSHPVRSVTIDDKLRVWVTRWDDGCLYVIPSSGDASSAKQTQVELFMGLPASNIEGGVIIRGDSLWIPTENGILLYSISQHKQWNTFLLTQEYPSKLEQKAARSGKTQALIRSIFRDSEGRIWCATSRGIAVIHPSNGYIQFFKHDSFDERSLSSNDMLTVYQDRAGVIWIGEGIFGVHKFAPTRHKFRLFRHNPFNPNTISNSYIRGILEDKSGRLWVATQFGGLNLLDRTSGKWTRFRHNPQDKRSIASDNVCALHEDNDGTIWVGLRSGALCTIDGKHLERGFTRHFFMDSNFYAQTFFQDSKKNLWIGTFTNVAAIYKLSPDRKQVEAIHKTHSVPEYCRDIQCIIEDKQGTIWIGAFSGLFSYTPSTKKFREYYHNDRDSLSLPFDFVTNILESSSGELWIATKGGGICRFDRSSGKFYRITKKEGLPDMNCYALLNDAEGNIWISSDNGIFSYNVKQKSFRLFTSNDGLQSKEYNRFSYYKSQSGEMFFGGVNGLNSFFPQKTQMNPVPAIPAVQRIRTVGGMTLANNITLRKLQEITIPPGTNGVTIDFAALEFSAPEGNLSSWYLEDADTAWTQPRSSHQALYANLSPGTYIFSLKAANADGRWNAQQQQIRLIVVPAWWQTWWFRLSASSVVICLIVLIIRLRVQKAEKRTQDLEYIVEQRTQELRESYAQLNTNNERLSALNLEMQEILGIASHDLKNPISAIMGLVDVLRHGKEFELTEETQIHLLNQITLSSERMMTLLHNLLEINALEAGKLTVNLITINLSGVVSMIVEEYQHAAKSKQIALHFSGTDDDAALVDEMMWYQIVDNLVSNAVKYTPHGKNIWVRLKPVQKGTKSFLRLEVQDEGPGLSEADKTKLFKRFSRLSARPTAGEDSTGLGLSIVKKMVETISANVWCESELGKGAMFIVEIRRENSNPENGMTRTGQEEIMAEEVVF